MCNHARKPPGRKLTEAGMVALHGETTDEQYEFLMAIEEYKSRTKKKFISYTEILEIVKALGYRKG